MKNEKRYKTVWFPFFVLSNVKRKRKRRYIHGPTGWSPTKIVQIVLIGCISRSLGQKIGFQKAIFKNLLVWNYKAQSFHVWYITSSRVPLPKLFKLCPWGQNWPRPGGHNFTLIYIRKTSNDFLSWTANGNLTKLNRNGPWVVLNHLFKSFWSVAYVVYGVKN